MSPSSEKPVSKPTFGHSTDRETLENGDRFSPRFGPDGLIPAIVTDAENGGVLMFAFMNTEALSLSIQTREAHFYSRSRARLWKKGEESGNTLSITQMRTDCDQDVVWLAVRVNGEGVACHTGQTTCFYREITLGAAENDTVALTRI